MYSLLPFSQVEEERLVLSLSVGNNFTLKAKLKGIHANDEKNLKLNFDSSFYVCRIEWGELAFH